MKIIYDITLMGPFLTTLFTGNTHMPTHTALVFLANRILHGLLFCTLLLGLASLTQQIYQLPFMSGLSTTTTTLLLTVGVFWFYAVLIDWKTVNKLKDESCLLAAEAADKHEQIVDLQVKLGGTRSTEHAAS